jgi:catechol 2,3-dioxygenase-like lactoylglutathione lyase family enzyme
MMGGMEVLRSRILLRPTQLLRSHRFYRDTLGLAIYREFGGDDAPGIVFFLGNGLLEVSGRATDPPGGAIALWMQVRDIRAEHRRLSDADVGTVGRSSFADLSNSRATAWAAAPAIRAGSRLVGRPP